MLETCILVGVKESRDLRMMEASVAGKGWLVGANALEIDQQLRKRIHGPGAFLITGARLTSCVPALVAEALNFGVREVIVDLTLCRIGPRDRGFFPSERQLNRRRKELAGRLGKDILQDPRLSIIPH